MLFYVLRDVKKRIVDKSLTEYDVDKIYDESKELDVVKVRRESDNVFILEFYFLQEELIGKFTDEATEEDKTNLDDVLVATVKQFMSHVVYSVERIDGFSTVYQISLLKKEKDSTNVHITQMSTDHKFAHVKTYDGIKKIALYTQKGEFYKTQFILNSTQYKDFEDTMTLANNINTENNLMLELRATFDLPFLVVTETQTTVEIVLDYLVEICYHRNSGKLYITEFRGKLFEDAKVIMDKIERIYEVLKTKYRHDVPNGYVNT